MVSLLNMSFVCSACDASGMFDIGKCLRNGLNTIVAMKVQSSKE